jgi:hypothetical protein
MGEAGLGPPTELIGLQGGKKDGCGDNEQYPDADDHRDKCNFAQYASKFLCTK